MAESAAMVVDGVPPSTEEMKKRIASFNQVMASIQETVASAKSAFDEGNQTEALKAMSDVSLLAVAMKNANRSVLGYGEEHMQYTKSGRERLDKMNLQLQNLLSEKQHYQEALRACKDFKSKEAAIDLVSKEAFKKSAPAELSGVTEESDPHRFHLNRLSYELKERQRLASQLKELQMRKQPLEKEKRRQLQFLNGLPNALKGLIDASAPMQAYMKLPTTSLIENDDKAAVYLPDSLYTMYAKIYAYQKSFGSDDVEVAVEGDMNAAAMELQKARGERTDANDEDEDDDAEKDDEGSGDENQPSRKKRRKNDGTQTKGGVEKKAGGAEVGREVFPAYVMCTLTYKNHKCQDEYVRLKFELMTKMRVIVASCRVGDSLESLDRPDCPAAPEVLSYLFPNDSGIVSPVDGSRYLVQDNIKIRIDEDGASFPYRWAQSLAGMRVIAQGSLENGHCTETANGALAAAPERLRVLQCSFEDIRDRIGLRLMGRKALLKHIAALSAAAQKSSSHNKLPKGSYSSNIKALSSFTSWKELESKAIDYYGGGQNEITCRVFEATFQATDGVKLRSTIYVHPDYPSSPPRFSVEIDKSSLKSTTLQSRLSKVESSCKVEADPHAVAVAQQIEAYDNDIKNIEIEVNYHIEDFAASSGNDRGFVLVDQLTRLQECFDMYRETDNAGGAGSSLGGGKLYDRALRGRDRRKPFVYYTGSGLYDQRK